MTDHLVPAEDSLVAALRTAVRGPRRNGLFAVWLLIRACAGLLPPGPLTPRAHRRRLESLQRRVSSLSLPPALRRIVQRCLRDLQEGTADTARDVLAELAAAAPDHLGADVGDALAAAAREAAAIVDAHGTPQRVGV